MALRVDAIEGLVLLSATPYDERVVQAVRALPQRRYRPAEQDWVVPARREQLRALCAAIAQLAQHGIDASLSPAATARLARIDVGWATLRDGEIHIAGPYTTRRLQALRALPERRFDPAAKVWVLPLTRAGALQALALAGEDGQLILSDRARHALTRAASPSATATPIEPDPPHTARRSPIAHWRHFTCGPVFDNPARPRRHVPGVGLCVRIRVDPASGRRRPS